MKTFISWISFILFLIVALCVAFVFNSGVNKTTPTDNTQVVENTDKSVTPSVYVSQRYPTIDSGSPVYVEGDYSFAMFKAIGGYRIDSGSYLFEDNGTKVTTGTPFVMYAEFTPLRSINHGRFPQVGFVLSTGEGRYLQIVYLPDTDEVYFWSDGENGFEPDGYVVYYRAINESGIRPYDSEGKVLFELVYQDGTYDFYINDVLACSVPETVDDHDVLAVTPHTIERALGTGNLRFGLSSRFGQADFSSWGFAVGDSLVEDYLSSKTEG